ncbi:unnamed protein product, partial [Musa acuminata var. zebrina]
MGSSEDEWELLQRERVDADAAAAPPPTTCKEMRIKEENNQSAGQPRHRLAVSPRWESRPIAFALLRWVAPSVSFAGYRGPHFGRQVNAGRARGLLAYKKTGAWPPVGRSVDAAGVTSAGGGGRGGAALGRWAGVSSRPFSWDEETPTDRGRITVGRTGQRRAQVADVPLQSVPVLRTVVSIQLYT